ncbi:hypothetical protein [Hymenobacter sp. BT491]|uniref:hypothetical protein n=1 Tax=Hymenobacter sp. BT491 TaxID=2766779 RepID=UPI001653A963|nr:hypothetical protein [Hymenobacter sp. BT491]MBC6991672.1 hypothetical protein [Hymenobacter sp. BT491]
MDGAWYERIGAEQGLLQGDFITGCPTLTLPEDLDEIGTGDFEIDVVYYNAVVITQSCDLSSKGADKVLLCPYFSFKDWLARVKDFQAAVKAGGNTDKIVKSEFDKLRKGSYVAFHLLNKDESIGFNDYQVVELGASFSVKRTVIDALVEKDLRSGRLLSPYREHLSQAFATYFMRVALPNDSLVIEDVSYYRSQSNYS